MEIAAFITLFLIVLGSYVFIFNTSNHLGSKLNELRVEMADRLARIETALGIEKKK